MTSPVRSQVRPAVSPMGHDIAESRADTANESPSRTSHQMPEPLSFEAALDRLVSLTEQYDLAELDTKIEADLRDAERMLARLGGASTSLLPTSSSRATRETAQHGAVNKAGDWQAAHHELADESAERSSNFGATLAIGLGLMLFVCGGALLAISMIQKRNELWSIGLPLVVLGQAGLIAGLLLQLDWLRHNSKKTHAALEAMDSHLKRLEETTGRITTTHSGPAQNFYSHYAQGASPHVLLADLKGQLDLLAQQMHEK